MREIKFKLWNNKQKEMQGTKVTNFFSLRCDGKVNFNSNMVTDKDMILLQFTGLLDSKGKEIYEGDIIRLDCGDERMYIVEYIINPNQSMCGFYLKRIIDSEVYSFGSFNVGIKVIGNIWENKELLK